MDIITRVQSEVDTLKATVQVHEATIKSHESDIAALKTSSRDILTVRDILKNPDPKYWDVIRGGNFIAHSGDPLTDVRLY